MRQQGDHRFEQTATPTGATGQGMGARAPFTSHPHAAMSPASRTSARRMSRAADTAVHFRRASNDL